MNQGEWITDPGGTSMYLGTDPKKPIKLWAFVYYDAITNTEFKYKYKILVEFASIKEKHVLAYNNLSTEKGVKDAAIAALIKQRGYFEESFGSNTHG